MNTNLVDLGTTVFVGAFLLVAGWLLLHIVFHVKSVFDTTYENKWVAVVVAVSCLAFGVVFENVSNTFVDEDRWYHRRDVLESDEGIKFESVFDTSDASFPRPKELALELARHDLFAQIPAAQQYVTDQRWTSVTDQAWRQKKLRDDYRKQFGARFAEATSVGELRDGVRQIYYNARNRSMREPTYAHELNAIQKRVDFSRTCVLIAVVLLAALVIAVLLRVILQQFGKFSALIEALSKLFPGGFDHDEDRCKKWKWLARAALLLVVLLAIWAGGKLAYAVEEEQYDKRVFGYYVSILDTNLTNAPKTYAAKPADSLSQLNGISGMAPMGDPTHFLVVHDLKSDEHGTRVAVLNVGPHRMKYGAVQVDDWGDPDGRPSDLEGVCRIPGNDERFLLLESSYWKDPLMPDSDDWRYGRIFQLKLSRRATTQSNDSATSEWQGVVEKVFHLPRKDEHVRRVFQKRTGTYDEEYWFNFEAISCIRTEINGKDKLFILLGDRGGHKHATKNESQNATLFCALLDDKSERLMINRIGSMTAPGWKLDKYHRHCTGIHLEPTDGDNTQLKLWVSASFDPDDNDGPFRSVIYSPGSLRIVDPIDDANPVCFYAAKAPYRTWDVQGLKVEALASWKSFLCLATDDENYRGIWRPLLENN